MFFHSAAQHKNINSDSLSRYGINPNYKCIKCDPVRQKNFYLLTVLEHDNYCRNKIVNGAALRTIYKHYQQMAAKPDLNCTDIPVCYTSNMSLDNSMIAAAAKQLVALYKTDATFRSILHRHLRESGAFMKWSGDNDTAMLAKAWEEEAGGINNIITRYTTNKGFRHPDIDSSSYYVKGAAFKKALTQLFNDYQHHPGAPLFFYPSLRLALDLLRINHRNEAARHEPLSTENKAPYNKIPATSWNKYPYSVILILGEGPDDNKPISRGSMHRCDMGAALYRQGNAPFIVVSGGYVHPFQTRYSEAIEMRKYLLHQYKIPASVIIVEPQARHTTTNIRNTARIIYRAGIPAAKKILCTSSSIHIGTILSSWFSNRNMSELGYLPYSGMKKISDTTVEFNPVVRSLYWDDNDPLDP